MTCTFVASVTFPNMHFLSLNEKHFQQTKPDDRMLKMYQIFLSIDTVIRNLIYLWNIHFVLCTEHYPCLQNLLHLSFLHAKSAKSCHLMLFIPFSFQMNFRSLFKMFQRCFKIDYITLCVYKMYPNQDIASDTINPFCR